MDNKEITLGKKKFSIRDIGFPKLIILLIAGIFLVITSVPGLFSKNETKTQPKTTTANETTMQTNILETKEPDNGVSVYEQRLKKLLKKMDGVEDAEVMITLKSSKERVVLKDIPTQSDVLSEKDTAGGTRNSNSLKTEEATVLVSDEKGERVPYVTKELEAEIEGVVIIAQYGGDGRIAASIVSAVEVLFGVPAHKVMVLPMGR